MLNLGCGADIRQAPGPGWVVLNVDRVAHSKHVDQIVDLNRLPWPWVSDSIWLVVAHSVLEHLAVPPVAAMNECWRVLRPGGRLDLKLPLWNSPKAHQDPTHRWFVAPGWLDSFDPETERGRAYGELYNILPWRIEVQEARKGATCLRGILVKREAVK